MDQKAAAQLAMEAITELLETLKRVAVALENQNDLMSDLSDAIDNQTETLAIAVIHPRVSQSLAALKESTDIVGEILGDDDEPESEIGTAKDPLSFA